MPACARVGPKAGLRGLYSSCAAVEKAFDNSMNLSLSVIGTALPDADNSWDSFISLLHSSSLLRNKSRRPPNCRRASLADLSSLSNSAVRQSFNIIDAKWPRSRPREAYADGDCRRDCEDVFEGHSRVLFRFASPPQPMPLNPTPSSINALRCVSSAWIPCTPSPKPAVRD